MEYGGEVGVLRARETTTPRTGKQRALGTGLSMRSPATEADAYSYIIRLVYDRCRVRLHDGKKELIRARLGKRMRRHGFETLTDYCSFLSTAGEDEVTEVVNALTTNFTSFLREEDHLRFMVQEALPAMLTQGVRRFKIWSAACASGEEPYSIAFYLWELYPPGSGWDWRILATDVSTKALDKGRQAVYTADKVDTMPMDMRRTFFLKGQGDWTGHYRVKPEITERVSFHQLNLLGEHRLQDTFEIIFCRNVMIYFDRPTQEQLVNRLCKHLAPGGYLLVGHSESLSGLSMPLRTLRPSIYQKR